MLFMYPCYGNHLKFFNSNLGVATIFPMYTVPMDVLLQMKEVRTYEGMLESGSLVEFEEQMGQAMFVSHQWLSIHHPDPDAEQLRTLQRALNNILSLRMS